MRRFLGRHDEHQSCLLYVSVIAGLVAGRAELALFDIAIFDEAHKTTGPQGGLFARSLSDENIRIWKRLFFTATPRHYDIRHRE